MRLSKHSSRQGPFRVFVSYSHRDKAWRDRLETHLSAMVREGLIRIWFDRNISPGKKWMSEIAKALEESDIFLALVSADFIASEYCFEREFERALERSERGECLIIPINLQHCDWHPILKEFQALPSFDQPVAGRPDPNQGFAEVAHMLRALVRQLMVEEVSDRTPPASPTRTATTLDPALPYLCDRTDQETGLIRALKASAVRDTRPVVLVTCGHPDECHEAFLARVRRSPLPRLLGLENKPDPTSPVPLNWPTSLTRGATPQDVFELRVANCLGTLDSDPRKIVRQLPAGMTVIDTSIWFDRWSDRDESLLTSYLDFWNTWPPLPAQRALVVSIALKYRKGRFDVDAFRRRLDFGRWPRLRGVVLDELARIPVGDAENWAKRPEVRRYYEPAREQQLCNEIRSVFRADRLPMNTLAPSLLIALQKLASVR